jgi:hypothetical protein
MSELQKVGGHFNCHGNAQMSEDLFPNLEEVGGDLILAGTSFTKLPPKLKNVGGRGIVSRNDHQSLIDDMIRAHEEGIIKGGVFFCD